MPARRQGGGETFLERTILGEGGETPVLQMALVIAIVILIGP